LRFLRECLPGRTRRNISAIVAMSLYSRRCLGDLRAELDLQYDQLERGILHVYTDTEEFLGAIQAAKMMREFGLNRETVDISQCLEIEPALIDAKPRLVGGDFTGSDESGDAHKFTCSLAEHARKIGVDFRLNLTVDRIAAGGSKIAGVVVHGEEGPALLTADAYVVALGSYSPLLLKPLGITLPVYPAKGYSATLALADGVPAPTVSLTDDEYKVVFSRLGNRLRVAGTAEFNGYNLDLNPVRCQILMQRTQQLFPNLPIEGAPEFWCGLRPATPSNVPYIGCSSYSNLWLNTGHGTLGWTMSCGSAAALADMMSGKRPEPDFPFIRC
jgi:D-amino-acid dehydrogenase